MVEVLYTEERIWEWLNEIADPEIPVLSILDLGIVRKVYVDENGKVQVVITPTYSGCPAMDVIGMQIRMALLGRGVKSVEITQQLSPAWTTDWMTDSGKQKLEAYGIAPPLRKSENQLGLFEEELVSCPKCKSDNTQLISRFSATSCKSMYTCNDCHEPFEHFKCH